MTKFRLFLLFFIFFQALPGRAQSGFYLYSGQKQVDIPFEYINNFIIVTLNFNGSLPLKFIFDTGAEHTILSKREITDMLRLRYEREFRVTGSDLKTELIAYLVRNVRLDVPQKATAPRQDILVLQEDYFRFEEYAGVRVQGILAASAFARFMIKINYQTRFITLYDRASYKLRESGFVEVPIEMFRNKMYLKTNLQVRADSIAPAKLLLDTGAGLPLLLFANTHPLIHPPANAIPSNIGMGLGGYLEGFTGRINSFDFGPFAQNGVVTYFQMLDTTQNLDHLNKRNGLVGNAILDRFQIILDYQDAKIWLKPNRNASQPYVYDRSGLTIIASGLFFSTFIIQNVLPASPAAEADLRHGDIILRMGLRPANLMTLADLQRSLQKKAGKKVKLLIERDGRRIKKTFVLRDLI
ncbi:MAG: aspartyl protease family protein [Saprospiraceae bacterium]